MGIRYLLISLATSALGFVGLIVWTDLCKDRLRADGIITKNISLGDSQDALQLFLSSRTTIALLASFVLNLYILLVLNLKTLFFGDLYAVETKKLVERLANYIIYKGTFLPLVVLQNAFQGILWTIWLIVLCTLKMFLALARERLERLSASPSSTPWTYFRVYSALFMVLSVDLLWIKLSLMMYNTTGSSLYILLLFEPCSVAFETLQALLIHGFQLLDMLINDLAVKNLDCQRSRFLDSMTAGSLLEWKGILNRNLGFFLDMANGTRSLFAHVVASWNGLFSDGCIFGSQHT
ncbi:hypothetical protein EUTSA_v10014220mg [Eutrema salsugineum]|nr:hypothetical protein EUTSA_v10014220mg [Eutrema salsugineum]